MAESITVMIAQALNFEPHAVESGATAPAGAVGWECRAVLSSNGFVMTSQTYPELGIAPPSNGVNLHRQPSTLINSEAGTSDSFQTSVFVREVTECTFQIPALNESTYKGYYDPDTARFLNADALLSTGQGLLGYNMYAYCLNNPVNMSDPSGMCGSYYVPGSDSCCNRGQKISRDGSPIVVYQNGNSITIKAYVTISGDGPDASLIMDGIAKNWSGTFGDYTVTTQVYEGESPEGASLKINTTNGTGIARQPRPWLGLGWNGKNLGSITLFSSYPGYGRDWNDTEIGWIAAHEFGHALGLNDAYKSKTFGNQQSIMNQHLMPVAPIDIQKLLTAQQKRRTQNY